MKSNSQVLWKQVVGFKKWLFTITTLCIFLSFSTTTKAQNPPRKLAVYYGFLTSVNGATTDDEIVDTLSKYDILVLGEDLSLYESNTALWNRFDNIITRLTRNGVEVFGYIPLGSGSMKLDLNNSKITPDNPNNIQGFINTFRTNFTARLEDWKTLGVSGIFLDEAGFDFGIGGTNGNNITRQKQNAAVQIAYDSSLNVMMNAWLPQDIFDTPTGLAAPIIGTNNNRQDYYMLESFMITSNGYFTNLESSVGNQRYQQALNAQNNPTTNIKVVTLTTTAQEEFFDCQFNYAWWATAAYGFDAMGWGEPVFSAPGYKAGRVLVKGYQENSLPYRTRPNANFTLTGNAPTVNGLTITRTTSMGDIVINAFNSTTHDFSYNYTGNNNGNQFGINSFIQECGDFIEITAANKCVPISLGSHQYGLYTRSASNGISDCDCYNQISGTASMSILKQGNQWHFLFARDCDWQGEGSATLEGTSNNCDILELDCIQEAN